jgi:predicted NAD/FAD-binding protein
VAGPTRRSFLKTGSAAALALSVPGRARRLFAGDRPRVGIVGGGLAAVSCAWLLDGVADPVLFEGRAALGGHAQTIPVTVNGQPIQVDVGAQFFAPATHPTYTKLVEILGLLDPAHPGDDATVEADMTITVAEAGAERPRFMSASKGRLWPALASWNRPALGPFLTLALQARKFIQDGDWSLSLEDWLAGLPVPAEQREGLLLPLVSALTGCSIDQGRALSARSALFFIAKPLPKNLLDPIRYDNSLLGLEGNVQSLAAQTRDLTAHLGSAVTAVEPAGGGRYRVRNAAGTCEEVDVVVFATPPYRARPLLPAIPELDGVAPVLDAFEYFNSEIAIHRDPIYMPGPRRFWSSYNAGIDTGAGYCEGSVWYGALRAVPPGQAPLSLFKSWATARAESPREEIFRQEFRHPYVTPAFIDALRRLDDFQGRGGVWFAGSYTREVDSQESALTSAMSVVERIDPDAPNLRALQA